MTFARKHGIRERGEITRVQCMECRRKDAIGKRVLEQKRKKILCPEYRTGKKKL